MAALSITAANVRISSQAQTATGTLGATVTQGQSLYVDTANSNVLKLYDADAAAPANVFAGIALTAGAANQPCLYVVTDPSFTPGATILAGDTIWGSTTAGGITKTAADVSGSGVNVTPLGVGLTTTTMNLKPVQPAGLVA